MLPSLASSSKLRFLAIPLCLLGLATACTSKKLDPLQNEVAVLKQMGAPAKEQIDALEISARLPGNSPWRLRAEKRAAANAKDRFPVSQWEITYRSDAPESRDLADARFIEHFLDTLSTFTSEGEAPPATDEFMGFSPHRVEVRIRSGAQERLLAFGDPAQSQIYFRRGLAGKPGEETRLEKQTWMGRGAVILFLGNLQSPAAFQWKSPFLRAFEEYDRIELEKTEKPDAGKWALRWTDGTWKNEKRSLSGDQTAVLSHLFHQRLLRILNSEESTAIPFPSRPDWSIRIASEGKPEEEIQIAFVLGRVFAKNPARSANLLELYPEFAGALRAFTQARFTPLKSGTK